MIKSKNKKVVKDRKMPILKNAIKFNKQVAKDINSLNELSSFFS